MAKLSGITTPSLTYDEGAAPSTPAAGTVIIYAKSDGLLYSKDDAGTETLVSGGTGGSGIAYSGASVYRDSSGQAITSNTLTAIDFNGEEWDTDTYHDNATNPSRLTVPATGKYRVEGFVALDAVDNTECYVMLHVNGSDAGIVWREEVAGTSTYRAVPFSTVLSLTSSQYVEVKVIQVSGGFNVTSGVNRTRVHIQRLS